MRKLGPDFRLIDGKMVLEIAPRSHHKGEAIRELLQHDVDLVIDGGYCGMEATTVVDLVDETPLVMRAGKGDIAPFED